METAAAVLKHSELVKQLRRRDTVALITAFNLCLCFAVVSVERRFQLLRQRRQTLERFALGGVFRMETELIRYQLTAVIVSVELLLNALDRAAEVIDRAAQHRPITHIVTSLDVSGKLHVHIKRRSYTAREVLHIRELSVRIHRLLGELRLTRENLLVQPVAERKIVRERAQERHRRMGVCVLEPRDYQIAAEVDLAIIAARSPLRSDICDFAAVGAKLALDYIFVLHCEYFRVVKSKLHFVLLFKSQKNSKFSSVPLYFAHCQLLALTKI